MPEVCSPRGRPWRAAALALLCGLLAAGTLPAQDTLETRYGDIGVRPEPALGGDHSHGYVEYVLWVRNHSDSKTYRVTLEMPAFAFGGYGTYVRSITRTVEVGPEAVVRVSLLQPGQPGLGGQDVAVSINGSRQDGILPLRTVGRGRSYGYSGPGKGSDPLLILQSSGVKPNFGAEVGRVQGMGGGMPGGVVPGMGGPGGPGMPGGMGGVPPPPAPGGGIVPHVGTVSVYVTPLPVTSWTTSWLGLSRYDGVVLTGDELRAMPAAAQLALWQYVECGGALLVLGQAAVPDSWRREAGDVAGLVRYSAGFGTCLVSPRGDYEQWPPGLWADVLTSWNQTASPWRKQRSQLDANTEFPVVKDLGVPVVGLFLLMIVFTVIIGPVNVMLLSRRRRRIWLLWTVPAISLLACLAVMGYMILAEGWRGQRSIETFTILDQDSHRAATIGWTAFYSPLTPGGGLHFSPDTELTLQCAPEGGRYGYRRPSGSQSCGMDWTSEQHLTRGWVQARVPAHFMVRKNAVQRERVTVTREKDGRVAVVNGLGAAIKSFWYEDDKGQLYSGPEGGIPAGGRATLEAQHKKAQPAALPTSWRSLYRDDWLAGFRRGGTAAGTGLLQPRTYLAELDGTPFLEEGLPNARKELSHSWVLGLVHEGSDEG